MNKMLVLVPKITQRLRYVFDLVLHEQLGFVVELTTIEADFLTYEGIKICYGDNKCGDSFFLKATQLLFEREIFSQDIKPFNYGESTALFPVFNSESALPYDIFAASFYLVSRYEEYLPFIKDGHGRYQASSSIMFRLNLLQKPLVNIWCKQLGLRLKEHFIGLKLPERKYNFVPTYDIDAAWAYKNKGLIRTYGSFLKNFIDGDMQEIKMRYAVLTNKIKDPFDTFELQFALQQKYQLHPIYFILFANYDVNDKNIPIDNNEFQLLIKQLGDYADVGIHPSYASFDDKTKLKPEIQHLSRVLNREVTRSRQHFLRMNLPMTYHNLIDLDITDDYTMGYASQAGFRAGIADSFFFYDLDHDGPTPLRLHPFALMDGTLRDYLKIEPEAALELAKNLIHEVKNVQGTFITLWHNESLSNSKRWNGWLDVYKQIIIEAVP
jgi:hypothetical protein